MDITQEVVEESEDDRFEDMPDAAPRIELPACDLSKLEEIAELFAQCAPSLMKREKLTEAIESEGYIQKLLDLFHMCEDLENVDGLHHLYEIFKNIFMLNKNALFEIMFTEDAIFDVIGVMEYDPALSERAKHREFLKSTARFKEVIPLNNKDLIQKIHQTYRVQYILDVILPTPSVFEENNYSTLNTFIFFNKVEIVGVLQVSRTLSWISVPVTIDLSECSTWKLRWMYRSRCASCCANSSMGVDRENVFYVGTSAKCAEGQFRVPSSKQEVPSTQLQRPSRALHVSVMTT